MCFATATRRLLQTLLVSCWLMLMACDSYFETDPYHTTLPAETKTYFFYDKKIGETASRKSGASYLIPTLETQAEIPSVTNLLIVQQHRRTITHLKTIDPSVKAYDYRFYAYFPKLEKTVLGYTNSALTNLSLSFYRIWYEPQKKLSTGHVYLSNINRQSWYLNLQLSNFSTKGKENLQLDEVIYKGKVVNDVLSAE